MKVSRIDLQARLGDEVLCGECWIELGGIDCRCSGADRSGQDGLLDQMEMRDFKGPEKDRQGRVLLAAVPESARPAVVTALKARAGK